MIHLMIGTYYSLDGAGADIWAHLASGRGRAETLALLEQRYDAESGLIAETVDDLVRRLAEEGLLEPAPDGASAPNGTPAEPCADRSPFKPPQLEKYTDMQDFLLVDPIHETDETGWPSQHPAR
jgi:Coenzyme PQQ synthesis protein D (PqqD)